MSDFISLSSNDKEKLANYLLEESNNANDQITVLLSDGVTKTLALNQFDFFKSDYDLNVKLQRTESLATICVGTIPGQASKFGIFDLNRNQWLMQNEFQSHEVVASCYNAAKTRVYLACWAYRFMEPPLFFAECISMDDPTDKRDLELIGTELMSTDREDPGISLDEVEEIVFFYWGNNLYKFLAD